MSAMAAAAGIGAGAQILGSIAQYYQSEKNAKATSEKLDEIKRLFEAIKPPEFDYSVQDPPQLISESIPEAAFDLSKLTPQQFELVGKYVPQAAPYIAEKNPQLVQLSATGQAGRNAQVTALQALRARTGELADTEAQQAGDAAQRKAQIGSQSRSMSILQDAQRRGQLGSGSMLAAQLQGSSDQMLQSADTSAQAALAAQRNKLMALKDSGTLGSQLSNQDFNEQETNADIINRYNQRATSAQQQYENQQAQMKNQAQIRNLDQAQNISNKNVQNANEYDVLNRKRQDALVEYGDKRRINERDYTNENNKYLAKYSAGERDRVNELKNKAYQNALDRVRGMGNMTQFEVKKDYTDTADRNQAIQGVASGVGSVANAYGNNQSGAPASTGGTKSNPGGDLPDLEVQDDRTDEEKQRRLDQWNTN